MGVLLLCIAIASEVMATTALKASEGFTRVGPSVVVVIGYAAAFYALSHSLRTLPVGIAYATWAGIGTVVMTMIGWWVYDEPLNIPAVAGIAMIICGASLLGLYSSH